MVKTLILCIEDSVDNAEFIQFIFAKKFPDFRLQHARNASKGLELARKEIPALIIVDWSLPDMIGPEVVDQIKIDDNLRHIPVIILIGRINPIGPIKSKFKPDALVHKPIDVTDFFENVHRLLKMDRQQ